MEELKVDSLESVSGGLGGWCGCYCEIVNCKHRVNIRKHASADSTIIGHAHLGVKYKFHTWVGSWAKVEVNNGFGYISKKFIKLLP